MPANGAGRGAGRVEQHRIEALFRRPGRGVGDDRCGVEAEPAEIFAQRTQPRLRAVDRDHRGAGLHELRRLAAGRRAEIGHAQSGD